MPELVDWSVDDSSLVSIMADRISLKEERISAVDDSAVLAECLFLKCHRPKEFG